MQVNTAFRRSLEQGHLLGLIKQPYSSTEFWEISYSKTVALIFLKKTRTVRKSDYTPALALPKHMAGIFDEKCREKNKYREGQIGECPFSIPCHNLSL